jgi:hypothetical protein
MKMHMVLDSGTTLHFVWQPNQLPKMEESDKIVTLPNGEMIAATHTVNLPFQSLSKAVQKAHVLPSLKTNSLVSIMKLANAGYTTILHARNKGVTILDSINVMIQN